AVLRPGWERHEAGAPPSLASLRLLPGDPACRSGLAGPPRAVRRLPLLRPPLHPRPLLRRPRVRVFPLLAPGRGRGARGQPARLARSLVRRGRRAKPSLPRLVVRARDPLALRLGGCEPGRGRVAEAVRPRRSPVLPRD